MTIFAYGQTGSGKTHTMEGYEYSKGDYPKPLLHDNSDREGITIRGIRELWRQAADQGNSFTVNCSFLQLYNERVFDLLNLNRSNEGL